MWLFSAFASAVLLGFYDVAKKQALKDNDVLAVLFLNTLFSSIIFLPAIISAETGAGWFDGTILQMPAGDAHAHARVAVKAVIVLTSWVFGYYGIKHLPITLAGPINATRPVLVLLGAMLVFGERLNGMQWTGVLLSAVSFFMLSRSGRREGVSFTHNKWIFCTVAAAVTGAASGLYDRYIMQQIDPVFVQSWYNIYQAAMTGTAVLAAILCRHRKISFRWTLAIPLISVLITCADFVYFSALSEPDAMISVVSMIRRGSVIVSFACGAILFREKNLRSKAIDLAFILTGMVFLYFGSRQ
ncbi:MAG: DMT family transporter [Alistipes sp.]|nr:DMT family transporter [Alistipes sp.]